MFQVFPVNNPLKLPENVKSTEKKTVCSLIVNTKRFILETWQKFISLFIAFIEKIFERKKPEVSSCTVDIKSPSVPIIIANIKLKLAASIEKNVAKAMDDLFIEISKHDIREKLKREFVQLESNGKIGDENFSFRLDFKGEEKYEDYTKDKLLSTAFEKSLEGKGEDEWASFKSTSKRRTPLFIPPKKFAAKNIGHFFNKYIVNNNLSEKEQKENFLKFKTQLIEFAKTLGKEWVLRTDGYVVNYLHIRGEKAKPIRSKKIQMKNPDTKYELADFQLYDGKIQSRRYFDKEGNLISSKSKGKNTGSMEEFLDVIQRDQNLHRKILQTVKIYAELPKKFVVAFTKNQLSDKFFTNIPGIFEGYNKIHTKMKKIFKNTGSDFSLDKWNKLGFESREIYSKKLQLSVAEFFAGRVHVCKAKMRFACKGKQNIDLCGQEYIVDDFVSLLPKGSITLKSIENLPEVPIFSTPGIELRSWHYTHQNARNPNLQITKADASEVIKNTYSKMVFNLLSAAKKENIDQLNLIPFGLGVFLGNFSSNDKKALICEILYQYAAGINQFYINNPDFTMKIRFFGTPIMKKYLQSKLDIKVSRDHFELGDGDALQDALVRNQKGQKVGFVNAADGDWVYQLKKDKMPGECWQTHSLFNATSDEMVALFGPFSMMGNQDLSNYNLLEKSIVAL